MIVEAAGIALGIVSAIVLRLTTNLAKLRATRRHIRAHLMEFRLFFDEPALIARSQWRLLCNNARLLFLLTPAMLFVAPLTWWLMLQLEYRPFAPDEAIVASSPISGGKQSWSPQASTVLVSSDRVYWRLSPGTVLSHVPPPANLTIHYPPRRGHWQLLFFTSATLSALLTARLLRIHL